MQNDEGVVVDVNYGINARHVDWHWFVDRLNELVGAGTIKLQRTSVDHVDFTVGSHRCVVDRVHLDVELRDSTESSTPYEIQRHNIVDLLYRTYYDGQIERMYNCFVSHASQYNRFKPLVFDNAEFVDRVRDNRWHFSNVGHALFRPITLCSHALDGDVRPIVHVHHLHY